MALGTARSGAENTAQQGPEHDAGMLTPTLAWLFFGYIGGPPALLQVVELSGGPPAIKSGGCSNVCSSGLENFDGLFVCTFARCHGFSFCYSFIMHLSVVSGDTLRVQRA